MGFVCVCMCVGDGTQDFVHVQQVLYSEVLAQRWQILVL